MATPVGHSLLGLVLVKPLIPLNLQVPVWRLYALVILGANLPDFDFLPGLLVGDINLYHQGVSHSILFALLFAGIVSIFYKWFGLHPFRLALISLLAYASHLLMDLFSYDAREPYGIPLLWPLVEEHWTSPISLFSGVRHGVPGDDFLTFLLHVFSIENIIAISKEILSIVPVILCIFVVSYFRKQRQLKRTKH